MINGLNNKEFILSILKDGKPHYSREFVQASDGTPLLLDYRKRISEIRQKMGYEIRSMKIKDGNGNIRPGYQLFGIFKGNAK